MERCAPIANPGHTLSIPSEEPRVLGCRKRIQAFSLTISVSTFCEFRRAGLVSSPSRAELPAETERTAWGSGRAQTFIWPVTNARSRSQPSARYFIELCWPSGGKGWLQVGSRQSAVGRIVRVQLLRAKLKSRAKCARPRLAVRISAPCKDRHSSGADQLTDSARPRLWNRRLKVALTRAIHFQRRDRDTALPGRRAD